MPVYVALFGEKNYEWPECLRQSTIATPNDVESFGFWKNGDREGYIQFHIDDRARMGIPTSRALIMRWFNDNTRFSESTGDVWLHKQDGRVWWTRSIDEPSFFIEKAVPVDPGRAVIMCHKPCEPWRHVSEIGTDLKWEDLHPRAKKMLNSRITLQRLRRKDEAYMMALLRGEDLSDWHDRPDWRALAGPDWKDADADLSALDRAIARMAQMAYQTSLQSNGQKVLTTRKNKDFGFPDPKAMEPYLRELLNRQDNKCALSGLPLSFDGPDVDREMRPSLDRIDSNGHYEKDNLQVVAHFMNRWKGAYDNAEFKRLLKVLRG